MQKLPTMQEAEREALRQHNCLKWLLSLASVVITTAMIMLLNGQL